MAAGIGTATGAGAFVRVAFDLATGHANIVGLPGVAYMQDGHYYNSAGAEVSPAVDTEFVVLRSSRTGQTRLVSLAALSLLL